MITALVVLIISLVLSGLGPAESIGAFIVGTPLVMMFSAGTLLHLLPTIAPAAAIVGAALWTAGETRSWLRRRLPWIAAGALFALAYVLATAGMPLDPDGMLDFFLPDRRLQTGALVIGGSGAALAFRAAMWLLGIFFPPPDPADET